MIVHFPNLNLVCLPLFILGGLLFPLAQSKRVIRWPCSNLVFTLSIQKVTPHASSIKNTIAQTSIVVQNFPSVMPLPYLLMSPLVSKSRGVVKLTSSLPLSSVCYECALVRSTHSIFFSYTYYNNLEQTCQELFFSYLLCLVS